MTRFRTTTALALVLASTGLAAVADAQQADAAATRLVPVVVGRAQVPFCVGERM